MIRSVVCPSCCQAGGQEHNVKSNCTSVCDICRRRALGVVMIDNYDAKRRAYEKEKGYTKERVRSTHMEFIKLKMPKRRLTEVWECWRVSPKCRMLLGVIRWHSNWNNYAYFSKENALHGSGYLEDILEFLRSRRSAYKRLQEEG